MTSQHCSACWGRRTSPPAMRALSEKFAACPRSEAYPCREKSRKFWRRFSPFWLPNALLAANLSDNPAPLCVNGAFFCPTYGFSVARLRTTVHHGDPLYSEKSTPLLHISSILAGVIDAYLCRGNVLMSKRQTFLTSHISCDARP